MNRVNSSMSIASLVLKKSCITSSSVANINTYISHVAHKYLTFFVPHKVPLCKDCHINNFYFQSVCEYSRLPIGVKVSRHNDRPSLISLGLVADANERLFRINSALLSHYYNKSVYL